MTRIRGFCRVIISTTVCCVLSWGCGWKTLHGQNVSWSVGQVEGSSLIPGFKTVLRNEVQLASARRGVRNGHEKLSVRILSDGEQASGRLSSGSTVAFDTNLVIQMSLDGRSGCTVNLEMRRFWVVPPDFPLRTQEERAQAISKLAGTMAARGIDALIGEERCHSSEK